MKRFTTLFRIAIVAVFVGIVSLAPLKAQDDIADILDSTNQKMRSLNVIQQAHRKDFS